MKYTLSNVTTADGSTCEAIYFKDSKDPDFLILWESIEDHYASFKIYEVTSWLTDDKNTPFEHEEYLSGSIKWDGCSDFSFGGSYNSIHLCDKLFFDKHCNLMQSILHICSKKIKNFDHKLAGITK